MARLDDRLTPVGPGHVFEALEAAWQRQFGVTAHRVSLLVLLSQWALETGRGKSMHCFNLGNVKSNGVSGDWCFFRCNEIIKGKVVWFNPDDPACCFRAFLTLDDGAADYLQTLYERFRAAWPAVLAGDPSAFAHRLKQLHYYTADEAQYTKTLRSLFDEFSRTIKARPPEAPKPLPDLYTTQGVQEALTKLGFDPGLLDGIDGPHTVAAVRQFQIAYGLLPDGIVGRLTRSVLAQALLDPALPPVPRPQP